MGTSVSTARCVRWHQRVIAVTSYAPIALAAVLIAIGWSWSTLLLILCFLASVAGVMLVRELVRRAALRTCVMAVEHDGRSCVECGFDLRALGDTGRCPECGEEYSVDDLRAAWHAGVQWFERRKWYS